MHESFAHRDVVALKPLKVNEEGQLPARISPHVTQLPQFLANSFSLLFTLLKQYLNDILTSGFLGYVERWSGGSTLC
jgi:hypothetical protein